MMVCMDVARMINAAGLRLVQEFEGLSLEAYWDSLGSVWTIGWGHTGSDVHASQTITAAQADTLLTMDLGQVSAGLEPLLKMATTNNQFAAMVSFGFNLGLGALAGSTLLRLHNMGTYTAASAQFARWDHAGGKVVPGLLRRRLAEAALYLEPDPMIS